MPKFKVLPSEALFGFVAWLTTREPKVTFGSDVDASEAARLVGLYCDTNDFREPREGIYPDNLKTPKE